MRLADWRIGVPHRRVALGLSDKTTPSLVFVLVGIFLGSTGLGVVSPAVLAQFDPAVSVALAVLGVLIGAEFAAIRTRSTVRWVAAAGAQGVITLWAVSASMLVLLNQWTLPLPLAPLSAAVTLGLCCAASAAMKAPDTGDATTAAAALADLDDLLLVAFGGLAIAVLSDASPVTALGMTIGAGGVIALAGAVLFEFADSTSERGVFVTGTVVLLGGSAAYAGGSPLLSGCVAGLFWARTTGSIATRVDADLRRLQHPLVGMLLILAGASIQFSDPLLWIAAPLVLVRLTGKLIGGMVAARLLGLPAGLLATVLTPPGVLGVALALNVQQVLSTGDTIFVSAVTVATVGAELLATVLIGSPPTASARAGERT